MNMNTFATRVGALLVALTAGLLVAGCLGARPRATFSPHSPPGFRHHSYVARVISVRAQSREAYVSCLAQREFSVWTQLKAAGRLAEVSVFETRSTATEAARDFSYQYLLLFRMPGMDPPSPDHAAVATASRCEAAAGAQLRRVERLAATPNAVHRAASLPTDERARTERNLNYTVEYIAVRDSRPDLREYRSAMSHVIGPAIATLVKQRFMYEFIALETVAVLFADPGYPHWNQIHVSGYFADVAPSRLDELDAALDRELRRHHPTGHGLEQVFGRLGAIRTKPREDEARLLFELVGR